MTQGWAFLVARGRHHGYRSILVPDFIANNSENGYLTENVRGAADGSDHWRIEQLVAPASGQMTLAYHTHRLTHGDLDPAGGPTGDPGDLVTDEHGRPLDLLYGFAVRGEVIDALDEADLRAAKDEALPVYRRFLADEAGFSTQTSKAFPLRSAATRRTKPLARPVIRPATATAVHSTARPASRPAITGSRLWTILIGVITIAIVAILGKQWLASPSPEIAVDGPLECTLKQADDGLTCDIPVHITTEGATDQTTVNATTQPRSRWSVDLGDCRTPVDGGSCTLHVTIDASNSRPETEQATTVTLTSQQPHHTQSFELTARTTG
jgi:hypothetical protein